MAKVEYKESNQKEPDISKSDYFSKSRLSIDYNDIWYIEEEQVPIVVH